VPVDTVPPVIPPSLLVALIDRLGTEAVPSGRSVMEGERSASEAEEDGSLRPYGRGRSPHKVPSFLHIIGTLEGFAHGRHFSKWSG